jgi:hypothetical protein
MDSKELSAMGGRAKAAKYPHEHYQAIGRKGAEALKQKNAAKKEATKKND